jgi:hypothetical protein
MIWSSGLCPIAEVVASAAATPAIRTGARKRILLSSGPAVLSCANQPCDEKAVGATMAWRQYSADAIQTPRGEGRFLDNP